MLRSDTHSEIARRIIEGYRRMTPAQRIERMQQMTLAVQELALAGLRRRHPDASERELELRLASLRLGAETMRKVFQWEPDR